MSAHARVHPGLPHAGNLIVQAQGPNKCCLTALAASSGLAFAAELLTSLSTFHLDPQAEKPGSRLQLSKHGPVDVRCLHLEQIQETPEAAPMYLCTGELSALGLATLCFNLKSAGCDRQRQVFGPCCMRQPVHVSYGTVKEQLRTGPQSLGHCAAHNVSRPERHCVTQLGSTLGASRSSMLMPAPHLYQVRPFHCLCAAACAHRRPLTMQYDRTVCAGTPRTEAAVSQQSIEAQTGSQQHPLLCTADLRHGSAVNGFVPCQLGMSISNDALETPQHPLLALYSDAQVWFGADGAVGYAAALSSEMPLWLGLQQGAYCYSNGYLGGSVVNLSLARQRPVCPSQYPLDDADTQAKRQEADELLERWDQCFQLKPAR